MTEAKEADIVSDIYQLTAVRGPHIYEQLKALLAEHDAALRQRLEEAERELKEARTALAVEADEVIVSGSASHGMVLVQNHIGARRTISPTTQENIELSRESDKLQAALTTAQDEAKRLRAVEEWCAYWESRLRDLGPDLTTGDGGYVSEGVFETLRELLTPQPSEAPHE